MKRYSMKEISAEKVIKTCEYGIRQCKDCIDEALSGKVRVNDLEKYIDHRNSDIAKYESGYYDNTLHFLSKAIYLQFGESVPIMSK